ncbi:MAG: patatin-like phospholipase family protein [Thermoleophilia bacterium]
MTYAHNNRRDRHPMTTDDVSIVLSGGGAKGSFEVGAMAYLTTKYHFKPRVLSGTSMGAILAVQLAQAHTPEDLARLVQEVRQSMLDVADPTEIFTKAPWLAEYDDTRLGKLIESLLATQTATRPPRHSALGQHGRKKTDDISAMRVMTSIAAHPLHSLHLIQNMRSLPLSFMVMDPLENALRGIVDGAFKAIDEEAVRTSGIALRMPVTALRAGTTRLVTESGVIIDNYEDTVIEGAGHPGVIEGTLASASIPVIFEPRQIGDDYYVDGGAIRNLPVIPARRAGATNVIAIAASPLDPSPIEWQAAEHGFLNVLGRVAAITAMDSSRRSALEQPRENFTMTVIHPTLSPVGVLETSRPLLNMNFDYGWLRAAETVEFEPEDALPFVAVSDDIINTRELAYFLELEITEAVADTGKVPKDGLADLEVLRAHVRSRAQEWVTSGLTPPVELETWGHAPEHPDFAEIEA